LEPVWLFVSLLAARGKEEAGCKALSQTLFKREYPCLLDQSYIDYLCMLVKWSKIKHKVDLFPFSRGEHLTQ
jgi:hypothetical protein